MVLVSYSVYGFFSISLTAQAMVSSDALSLENTISKLLFVTTAAKYVLMLHSGLLFFQLHSMIPSFPNLRICLRSYPTVNH